MRVTIKEIAKELGLSHSTVSRVLNDRQSSIVSDITRDRILDAAKTMGYRPNRIAQALKGEQTRLIGVFMPDGRDYFFREVLYHLRALVEENGYELIPFAASQTNINESWLRLLRWDLDGVFVFDYLFYVDGLGKALEYHTGYVPPMVGMFNPNSQITDFVALKFNNAVTRLIEHLVHVGCKSIGYVAPAASFVPLEERYAVYAEFLKQRGQSPFSIPLLEGESLCEAAKRTIDDFLSNKGTLPDALFCQNDEIALGVQSALRSHGLAVPSHVALAGCDDIPYMAYLETPLTTLTLPVATACHTAWEALQRRMSLPDSSPMQVFLEAELTVRSSTMRITDRDYVSAHSLITGA